MLFGQLAAVELNAVLGIMVGFGMLVVLPVIAIMTEHQRKMARIIHGLPEKREVSDSTPVVVGIRAAMEGKHKKDSPSDTELLDELRALRAEVSELRMQVAYLQPGNNINREL